MPTTIIQRIDELRKHAAWMCNARAILLFLAAILAAGVVLGVVDFLLRG